MPKKIRSREFTLDERDFADWYRKEAEGSDKPASAYLSWNEYVCMAQVIQYYLIHRMVEEQQVIILPQCLGNMYMATAEQNNKFIGKRVRWRKNSKSATGPLPTTSLPDQFYYLKGKWEKKLGGGVRNKRMYKWMWKKSKHDSFSAQIRQFIEKANTDPDIAIIRK